MKAVGHIHADGQLFGQTRRGLRDDAKCELIDNGLTGPVAFVGFKNNSFPARPLLQAARTDPHRSPQQTPGADLPEECPAYDAAPSLRHLIEKEASGTGVTT